MRSTSLPAGLGVSQADLGALNLDSELAIKLRGLGFETIADIARTFRHGQYEPARSLLRKGLNRTEAELVYRRVGDYLGREVRA